MNDTTIPMTRAERLILDKIVHLEKKIDSINHSRILESIQEISLNKAARLLKVHPDKVIGLIQDKKLKARKYRGGNKQIRYRINLRDLQEFQKRSYNMPNYTALPDTSEVLEKVDKQFEGDQ